MVRAVSRDDDDMAGCRPWWCARWHSRSSAVCWGWLAWAVRRMRNLTWVTPRASRAEQKALTLGFPVAAAEICALIQARFALLTSAAGVGIVRRFIVL